MGFDEPLLHVDEEMPQKRQRTNEGDASTASAAEMSRISKSCDLCKMKKVKCDGSRPRCSFCVKNGCAECIYSIMKKPGLKPGYGKSMSERMDSLETELDALRQEMRFIREYQPQKQQPQMSISIDTIPKPNGSELTRFQLPHSHICLALIDLFFSEVIPMFPLIHPTVADELKKGIQGGQEPTLLIYAVVLISLKFLDDSQMKPQQKNIHYQNCKEKIITTSLKKINIESLQSMIILAYDSLSGTVKVPESWNYVSIAADYATYLKLGHERANKITFVYGESPDSINSSITSDARRKSKSISNKSLNLLRRPINWVDEESRRHCFWCIYILDKLFAISSSHEMKLKSSRITTLLPLRLSSWAGSLDSNFTQLRTLKSVSSTPEMFEEQPDNDSYDSFTYYIELNRVVGDIHTFLIEDFDISTNTEVMSWRMKFKTLETQLFGWLSSLPQSHRAFLENGCFPSAQIVQVYDALLFVYYYTTLIKLHSAFGYPHAESDVFKASEDSKSQCMEASTKVYNFVVILPQLFKDESVFERLGPHFGFYIWINSRILFVNVIYQATNRTLERFTLETHQTMLSFFSQILLKIGHYWESSKVYYKILQFLNVSDLSYVLNITQTSDEEDDDEDITGEHRAPAKVMTDMRIGSHSLLFWFNELAGKSSRYATTPSAEEPAFKGLSVFQTSNGHGLEEFQLTHDDFFNFLAMDINGSETLQDLE